MTATLLETIEQRDFSTNMACEHLDHELDHVIDEPAAYLIRDTCAACPRDETYLLCDSGWRRFHLDDMVYCSDCFAVASRRGEGLQILRVLT